MITVIGGANFDISVSLITRPTPGDSTPAHISTGCGGVARNIAHNLVLMGADVTFITALGDDIIGDMLYADCKRIGMNMEHAIRVSGATSGTYICFNDYYGDMDHAAADTSVIDNITPEMLSGLADVIGSSDIVVADCNLPYETLLYLIDNVTVPLYIDGVSTSKAAKVITALESGEGKTLHAFKINRQEALALTMQESVEEAMCILRGKGIKYVYVTCGADGVLFNNDTEPLLHEEAPAVKKLVNTTGAGDAFLAGLVHGFADGMTDNDAVECGLEAARRALLVASAVNEDL